MLGIELRTPAESSIEHFEEVIIIIRKAATTTTAAVTVQPSVFVVNPAQELIKVVFLRQKPVPKLV